MKKTILMLGILMFCAGRAHASDRMTQTENVTQVLSSTHTCYAITVSSDQAHASHTATTLINISTTSRMSFVGVLNEDTTLNLSCSERIGMTATGAGRGLKVKPGQFILWTLNGQMQWYCLNNGTAGTTNAVACRGR